MKKILGMLGATNGFLLFRSPSSNLTNASCFLKKKLVFVFLRMFVYFVLKDKFILFCISLKFADFFNVILNEKFDISRTKKNPCCSTIETMELQIYDIFDYIGNDRRPLVEEERLFKAKTSGPDFMGGFTKYCELSARKPAGLLSRGPFPWELESRSTVC